MASGTGRRSCRSKSPSNVFVPPISPASSIADLGRLYWWRVATPGTTTVSRRQVLERCKHLRDDHLRYMQQWGSIQPAKRRHGELSYAFTDVTVIRQADADLAGGASFRAVMRRLPASPRAATAAALPPEC